MNLEFLKPTWKKFIVFAIILILIYSFLYTTKAPIFPCQKKLIFDVNSNYEKGFCNVCSVNKYCKVENYQTQSTPIGNLIYILLIIIC